MDIVPVMIVTLCRYEHLVRCIDSLRRNKLAVETELYIGLDYPLKQEHWEGYNKICAYLENGVDGFKQVRVIKHAENLGATENYNVVKGEIYKKYDAYIYMEDDNVVSPNYLEYMNKSMDRYRNDPQILAVSGYMYPIDISGTEGNIVLLSTYFSCFGFGVYRRIDELFDQNITLKNFDKLYHNRKMMGRLRKASANQYGNFVKGMLQYTGDELIRDGEIRKIDLAYGLYMFFHGYKMVFPVISKMRNCGFDGSGEHCGVQRKWGKDNYREYDFSQQDIDLSDEFEPVYVKTDMEVIDWNERLTKFFAVTKKEMYMTMAAYYLSLIVGRETVTKLIKRIRRT